MCLTLILHADDFGLSAAVTDGILRGLDHGLLTSTSLLANAPYAERAIAAWQRHAMRRDVHVLPMSCLRNGLDDSRLPFDLGVHLNLTQGRPLTGHRYPAALLDREGRFPGVWRLFCRLQDFDHSLRKPILAELIAQIALLADHGIQPTHLNGHQYVEMLPLVAGMLPELLSRFGIPAVRVAAEPALSRTVLAHDVRPLAWLVALVKRHYAERLRTALAGVPVVVSQAYFGTAHAGRIDADIISMFLDHAGRDGVVEIGLHPGLPDDSIRPHEISDGWLDPLADWRPRELEMLESPTLARRLRARGVQLGRLAAPAAQKFAA